MQYMHGQFAQKCNARKRRSGSFWSGRYHPTLVQSGAHLSRCLFYIGLNMVRAKAVTHPFQWAHSGYHELLGQRQRYRVLNVGRLLWALGMDAPVDEFRRWYAATIDELTDTAYLVREPLWSTSVAVGDRQQLDALDSRLVSGRRHVAELSVAEPLTVAEAQATYALTGSRRTADALLFSPRWPGKSLTAESYAIHPV